MKKKGKKTAEVNEDDKVIIAIALHGMKLRKQLLAYAKRNNMGIGELFIAICGATSELMKISRLDILGEDCDPDLIFGYNDAPGCTSAEQLVGFFETIITDTFFPQVLKMKIKLGILDQ